MVVFNSTDKNVDHGGDIRVHGVVPRKINALPQHPGVQGILESVEGAFNVHLLPDNSCALRIGEDED